jgi:membrane fusion protein (multidrug efflux system)
MSEFSKFARICYKFFFNYLKIKIFCMNFIKFLLLLCPQTASAEQPTRLHGHIIQKVTVISEKTTIFANISARIAHVAVSPGSAFKKGDRLLEFDCQLFNETDFRNQRPVKKEMGQSLQSKSEQRTSKPENILETETTGLKKSWPTSRKVELMVEICQVRAPFDGSTIRILSQVGETVTKGKSLIEIAGEARMEMEISMPVTQAATFKVGQNILVHSRESGQELVAVITAVSIIHELPTPTLKIRAITKK